MTATPTPATKLLALLPGTSIVPIALLQARAPQRILERHWLIGHRYFFWIIIGGVFEPIFYLMSIRLGLDRLMPTLQHQGTSVTYTQFVAPGLLAASAMNGAAHETMNVFFRLKHSRTYVSILATPLTPGDLVIGDLLWASGRGLLYAASFMTVMAAMGMIGSWYGLLMLPAAALITLAFGAAGIAAATYLRTVNDFEYILTALLPLFLFSATFYPASVYGNLQWLVQLSPLYHGVALLRALNLGQLSWALLGHSAVLLAMTVIFLVIGTRRLERELIE